MILGVTRPYLSQIETGREPGQAFWKVFLESEQNEQSSISNAELIALPPMRKVRVISWAQAGEAIDYEDIVDYDDLVETTITDPKAFAIRIKGDSMSPRIEEGDVVVVMPSERPISGDTVIARLKDDGVICKLFHLTGKNGRTFRLTSYNLAYPQMEREEKDFHWIYPVGEQKRFLRRK